jgi:hypothetical protein
MTTSARGTELPRKAIYKCCDGGEHAEDRCGFPVVDAKDYAADALELAESERDALRERARKSEALLKEAIACLTAARKEQGATDWRDIAAQRAWEMVKQCRLAIEKYLDALPATRERAK